MVAGICDNIDCLLRTVVLILSAAGRETKKLAPALVPIKHMQVYGAAYAALLYSH